MSVSSQNLFSTAGILVPKDACVVIVRTQWNDDTVTKLEEGCNAILDDHEVKHSTITVPGAFEIPFTIKSYWEIHKYKDDKPCAFIALGCVLKGDTPHFEYVCQAVTNGVLQLNLTLPVPTIFGILTVDDQQQIDDRTGGKHGHKGEEAAVTALKMIAFGRSLK
jgi:6,7-dimethyl-8-ribityllumazine synthase